MFTERYQIQITGKRASCDTRIEITCALYLSILPTKIIIQQINQIKITKNKNRENGKWLFMMDEWMDGWVLFLHAANRYCMAELCACAV